MRYEREVGEPMLYRFRDEMIREKLMRLMTECRESRKGAEKTRNEAPTAAFVDFFRLPVRIAKDGEAPPETERTWCEVTLFEPLRDKQTGDSVELSDTDLRHQQHGLVIRGDEAARAVRIDEVDHDSVAMQRDADVKNWVVGYADVDTNLATRLGVDTPVSPVNREGEAEIEKTTEDVRTLWIDVDGQQERHKEWRAVVQESYVERYWIVRWKAPTLSCIF